MDNTVVRQNKPKSANIALLLCFFLGYLGIHRFYAGRIFTGILMLLTLGLFGIWIFIDLVYIASGHFTDSDGNALEFRKTDFSPLLIILLILPLYLAPIIMVGGLFFAVVYVFTSDVVKPAEQQLLAIKTGKIEEAYSYTSKGFRKSTSLEDFKTFIQENSLETNRGISFGSRSVHGNTAKLTGTIKLNDGREISVEYSLVKEDGIWKIHRWSKRAEEITDPSFEPSERSLKKEGSHGSSDI